MFGDDDEENVESMEEEESPEEKGFNEMFEDINKDEDYYRSKKSSKFEKGKGRGNQGNKKSSKKFSEAPKSKRIKKSFKGKKF